MPAKRLFIAINFSDNEKDVIANCIESIKGFGVRGNFTRVNNLHLTLVFIGETERENDIIEAMDAISARPFELSFDALGKFAHSRGDIYWLGVKKCPELFALQASLSKALSDKGFRLEDRPYKPHITLAREVIAKNPRIVPPKLTVKVNSFELMESARKDGILEYIPVYSKKL